MNRQTLLIWYILHCILFIGGCSSYCLQTPTYMSEWEEIMSQDQNLSELFFGHGLGEIPIKVVTEVKVTNSGKDYIFHAMGSAHVDDDSRHVYGGIVYMYNDVEVRVFAPNKYNTRAVGLAMYTGSSTSWIGSFHEKFSKAYVRVKAWKKDSLPVPDYESSWIDLDVTNETLLQQEFEHGLGDFPSMVVVQVRGLEDYISEAEGMSTLLSQIRKTTAIGGVLYGYSNETIRIWIPRGPFQKGTIYTQVGIASVCDGWGQNLITMATMGSCKIYAWKFHHASAYTFLESGDIDTTVEIHFTKPIEPAHALIITEVQPNDGVNSGFRFRAAASAMNDGIGHPYGGLFYGYNNQAFVMWKPVVNNINRNGSIFNIGYIWGGGKYSQSTNDVTISLTVWDLLPQDSDIRCDWSTGDALSSMAPDATFRFPEVCVCPIKRNLYMYHGHPEDLYIDQVRCRLKGILNEKNYQFSIGAHYNQTAEFGCLPNYTYIKGSRYRTCQRNCTWSGSNLKCQAPQTTIEKTESTNKLRMSLKETSRYKRSLTSAQDNRTSAKVVGIVTTSALSIPAILIIGSEVSYLLLSFLHEVIKVFYRNR